MVRLLSGLASLALAAHTVYATALPDSSNDAVSILPYPAPRAAAVVAPAHALERRKGGGGRSSGGSSSGSSSGGGRSSGGSSSSGRTSSASSVGGSTRAGSGAPRSFGGGGYYAGGASVPYSAGRRTPKGLIAAPLLVGAGALAIMPGLWLYSVYPYYYNTPYTFRNRSANRTNNIDNNNDRRSLVYLVTRQDQQGANETLPVVCLCQQYSVCGCDENTDSAYIDDLVGNGSYAALNKTLITVSDVNNTKTLVLNGTLPNGTTAPGGTDDSAAGHGIAKYTGYWAMGLVVLYGVML
ncbi:hypothetical protein ACEQ8H_008310 [Pleosporales sp. CAS-2024a]